MKLELRSELEAAAENFATRLVDLYRQACADIAQDLRDASLSSQGVRAPKPSRTQLPPAPARGQSKEIEQKILDLITRNPNGLRARDINSVLGTITQQLERPISHLLAKGRIRRTGQSSGTRYFPA